MKKRSVLFLSVLFISMFFAQKGEAQEIRPESVTASGYSVTDGLRGWISDSTGYGSVPLAHIFLIHKKDTIKLVADLSGQFSYQDRLPDTMQVKISALGFKPFTGLYIPKKHGLGIRICMQQESVVLNEVIITGKRVVMVLKGDTLQYNADVVKTLDGDMIGRILEKLPGVNMENGLKVNGIDIARICVNGDSTLFKGTEALKYITADNVKKLEVYDERNKEDLARGFKHGRREKVMNVITYNKVLPPSKTKQRKNSFTLGGGADASRYRTSRFPEKFLTKLDYNYGQLFNNGGRLTADYSNLFLQDKQEFGGNWQHSINRKQGKFTYTTKNSYRNTTIYSNQWREEDYFPTEQWASRRNEQSSSNKNTHYCYDTYHGFKFKIKKIFFYSTVTYKYHAKKDWQNYEILSTMNDELMNSANVRDYNRDYTSSGAANLSLMGPTKIGHLTLSSNINISKEGRTGWQMDTLATSNRHIYLHRDRDNNTTSGSIEFRLSRKLSPLWETALSGSYRYEERCSKGIGKNKLTGLLDTNNSRNYSYYFTSNKITGALSYYGDKIEISGAIGVVYKKRNRIERFPFRKQTKDDFLSMGSSLNMKGEFSPTFNMSASYSLKTEQPSVEQLRIEIDDANPLSLRTGNPNLKQTKNHHLQILFNNIFVKQATALATQINFRLIQDPVVSNSRYFTKTKYLSEYDYTVEQGATLYSYENSDLAYQLTVNTNYEKFWNFLGKCNFNIHYEREKRPSFSQGEKNDFTTDKGIFNITLRTNFSKKVALTISTNTSFSRSASQLDQASKQFNEKFSLSARTNIIKFSVNASITYNYSKDFVTKNKVNQTDFNVSVSRNLGKYLSMSLNGNNLLDSKRSKLLNRTAEYFSRSVNSQTGRYVTMILSYKF